MRNATLLGRLRTSLAGLLSRLEPTHWLPASRYWRNVLTHFALGCALALGLRAAPEWGWFATKQDQAMDWMIRMQSGVSPTAYRGAPFVFLEINEATHRRWGEPFHTPRDRLARLIDFALEGGAALVLVDVDLSRPAGEQDRGIEEILRGRAGSGDGAHASEPRRAPILLARTFREPWPPGSGPWREERRSFLDPLVADARGVHWASALFIRDADFSIRRFRNFEVTCNGAEPRVVPALQMLAAALVLDPVEGARSLREALRTRLPDCSGRTDATVMQTSDALRRVQLGEAEIDLEGDRVSTRILYNFGWRARGEMQSPVVPFKNREVRLFTRLPAHVITDSEQPVAPEIVRDRIVTIGTSHADEGDIHRTPVGDMPGAVILMNGVYSLLQHGSLKPPSSWTILGTQLLLICAVSLAFAPVGFYWAAMLATPLVIAIMLPFTFWLFQYGVWLDFAIPLGAVQIQALVRRYLAQYSQMRGRRNTLVERPAESEGVQDRCDESVGDETTAGGTGSGQGPDSVAGSRD